MAAKKYGKLSAIFKSGKGFTLTEMIVVLVVLAILAASGIGAASGYMKRSILTKNDNSAETIYQAAQTALQQMQKKGNVYYDDEKDTNVYSDEWIIAVTEKGTAFAFVETNLSNNMKDNKDLYDKQYKASPFRNFDATNAKTNESVHMRYVLNYSKNNASSDQSKLVKQLLQPYFADSTVFTGSITIELDVEKSADAYGKLHCSAKCLSVFFDSRAEGGFTTLSDDNKVPVRDASHRAEKSLIGYFDGYKGTVVDTVHLPKVQQGIVVKKFINETSTETVETKDDTDTVIEKKEVTHGWLTWASTLDTANLNGSKRDVYYYLELLNGNNPINVLILNEDFLLSDDVVGNARHSIDYSVLAGFANNYTWEAHPQKPVVTVDTYPVVYNGNSDSDRFTKDVTKTSITVNVRVYVKGSGDVDYRGATSTNITSNTDSHVLPLKITYVENEYNNDRTKKDPYIEYSLDITDLMNDQVDKARITIYPNYFSHQTMQDINDEKGIIPFKKGMDTDVDQLPPPKTIPLTDPDPNAAPEP